MQNKSQAQGRRSSNPKTFKVLIDGHSMILTGAQLLGDKSGWIPCHGKVGDHEVRSLSYKQIGDKTVVRDGQGKLAGCYDTKEFTVMAATFMSGFADPNKIQIGTSV